MSVLSRILWFKKPVWIKLVFFILPIVFSAKRVYSTNINYEILWLLGFFWIYDDKSSVWWEITNDFYRSTILRWYGTYGTYYYLFSNKKNHYLEKWRRKGRSDVGNDGINLFFMTNVGKIDKQLDCSYRTSTVPYCTGSFLEFLSDCFLLRYQSVKYTYVRTYVTRYCTGVDMHT